jgi:hypothetical protein
MKNKSNEKQPKVAIQWKPSTRSITRNNGVIRAAFEHLFKVRASFRVRERRKKKNPPQKKPCTREQKKQFLENQTDNASRQKQINSCFFFPGRFFQQGVACAHGQGAGCVPSSNE